MSWSIRIGRIAGIDTYLHFTFLLLLAVVALVSARDGHGAGAVIGTLAWLLTVFGCVLLHELGHALAARRYGIATKDITLLPIGGVARLERMPEDPKQELVVALAGPAVNVVIAAGVAVGLTVGGMWRPLDEYAVIGGTLPLLEKVLVLNVWLVLFNMLPAFPMDGGRVLRALLAMRMPYAAATRAAATVGQVMALGFGLWGVYSGQWMLLLIALFVWTGAEGEAQAATTKHTLSASRAGELAMSDFKTLSPADTLDRAVSETLAGSQRDFPVAGDGGRLVGLLTQQDLLKALHDGGAKLSVEAAMTPLPRVPTGVDGEPVTKALERLQESGAPAMPLLDPQGRVTALLTLDNVAEFMMLKAAAEAKPR